MQSIAMAICNLTNSDDRKIAKRAGAIGTLPLWFTVKQLDTVLEEAARYLQAMDREDKTNALQFSPVGSARLLLLKSL